MWKSISERNSQLFIVSQFFQALQFVIPVWIMFETGFLSTTQIAFLAGWAYLVQLMSELPTGAFADLVGRRWSVILAYVVFAGAFWLVPGATTFNDFLLIETLNGLATALLSGAQEALLYDSLKQDGREKDFAKVMAKNGFWYQIGLMVATAAGGVMYSYQHGLPFVASGVTAALGGMVAWLFVEPKIDSEEFSWSNYWRQIKLGASEVLKTTETRLLSQYYIVVGSLTWMCQTFFNSYLLIELGFGDATRGYIAAALRLLNITVLMRLIKNERVFTHRNTVIFFPTLMALAMLPGVFLQGIWGVPTVAGVMMASTARWILLSKYTNEVYESKYRATAISTLSMAIGVIYVMGTMLAGPIMASWGGVRTIFTLFGVIALVVIVPLVQKILRLPRYATE